MQAEAMQELILQRKKAEWASWVEEWFIKCRNARAQFERQWYINLAFVNGRHYISPIQVPGQGFRLTTPQVPPWRVRAVVNKTRKAVRVECAKLTSSRPVPTVLPATSEEEDYQAAQVAELLVKSRFGTADFERTYRSWIWWGSVCGVSYLKSYWSADAEDPDQMEQTKPWFVEGEPVRDPATGEQMDYTLEPMKGYVVIERVTPFHLYVPDLLAEDLNKQPFLIHATTRSPLWVKEKFGINVAPDSKASNTIMDAAFLIAKGSEDILDSCLVKEVWLKKGAHPDFPEGGIITVIANRVVQYTQQWPWPFPEYPFYKYDGIPTGGFYSDSICVDLIPLNKEYNRTRSQMIEIKNTIGKPKIMAQRGSINPRQINSEPTQAILYTPGFERPTIIPGAEVPNTMIQELEMLRQDFDDLSSQHEVSRGGTPAGVTSGTAISYLQEQDDVALTYQVASIEYAMEMLGKHYLKYVSKYWTDERLIRVVGKDSTFEAKSWKGRDLRGNTDVKITTGSALPFSKAARQAVISEWMQFGWMDPSTGMELMEMGAFDKAVEEMLVDKKQANRENMKMAALTEEECQEFHTPPMINDPMTGEQRPLLNEMGMPIDGEGQPWQPKPVVPVNSWDDHQQHIHWHNQYRKTQEFELLPPHAKEDFELHVQHHQYAIQGPMMGAMGPISTHMDPEQAAMAQEQEASMMQAEQDGQMQAQQMAMEQQGAEQQQASSDMSNMLTASQIALNAEQINQLRNSSQ